MFKTLLISEVSVCKMSERNSGEWERNLGGNLPFPGGHQEEDMDVDLSDTTVARILNWVPTGEVERRAEDNQGDNQVEEEEVTSDW